MFTAAKNFNHRIQIYKEDNHRLVTHGVFAISRHPSYFGWFLWSVGTQVFLINPISCIGFFFASWSFFNGRIEIEEEILLDFF